MWSNQNGRQEPTPNIDERRGSAQRIDRSQASLRQGMFFFHHIIINMEIDGDIMDVILNNQIKIRSPTEQKHEQGWWGGGAQSIRVTPKIRPSKIK